MTGKAEKSGSVVSINALDFDRCLVHSFALAWSQPRLISQLVAVVAICMRRGPHNVTMTDYISLGFQPASSSL